MKFKKKKLNRVVILGANSFIGKAITKKFISQNIKPVLVTRKNVDLEKKQSCNKLKKILKKDDIIIFIAAVAPVKNIEMLNQNLLICKNIIESLKIKKPNHVIYLSSDAVYSDSKNKINEKSETTPESFHGFMHLIRENMLKELKCKKTFVRPTLVYGNDDPHNGYGPNKFIRCAQNNEEIFLFGKGEERRDHIWVNDLAKIIVIIIKRKITGIVNATTGKVISFNKIAEIIKNISNTNIKIIHTKRSGRMPHNGYRAFKRSRIQKIIPSFKFNQIGDILKKIYKYY